MLTVAFTIKFLKIKLSKMCIDRNDVKTKGFYF